ncbi:hypothetical protein RPATATE_1033 [Rickettsia parkeri str. Tate's Hell]|uniref:Uncharacterized protein n=1 Tax=Rickettsia parkeri str. Tate's Hell TaxID=1359189 RepID=A0ABR5DNQ7_RICPA|nr:hypothetical protein RPAAT24_1490 [Rickettsia parkeri str. AT\
MKIFAEIAVPISKKSYNLQQKKIKLPVKIYYRQSISS